MPREVEERNRYAEVVGREGFALLDRLVAPDAPIELRELPQSRVLRLVWDRHFERGGASGVEVEVQIVGPRYLTEAVALPTRGRAEGSTASAG